MDKINRVFRRRGRRTLWCLVHGDSDPFKVVSPIANDVYDLQLLVFKAGENKDFRHLDAKNLTLWKVSTL
jgi:Crinkler effector protein N-terminal domain